MAGTPNRKITATKNYRLFHRSDENRALNLKKHRKLYESMKIYGYLPSFPVVCYRDAKGNLVVKDGQHRLAIAEELGLPVYYVEEAIDFDVALVNCTPKGWALIDYAQKWTANGITVYQDVIDFADQYGIALGVAAGLLSGTASWKNIQNDFMAGKFRIKDRVWAENVTVLYSSTVALSKNVRSKHFIDACMACCRVEKFDIQRFLHGAERCREKLVPYSTRDAYLDMMESIYNFNRATKNLVPLKHLAVQAMRERNAVYKTKKAKAEKAGSSRIAS